jgi:hypothetical protein
MLSSHMVASLLASIKYGLLCQANLGWAFPAEVFP